MSKQYALWNENGRFERMVAVNEDGDMDGYDLPAGWTIRDSEGAVVEFDTAEQVIVNRIWGLLADLLEAIEDWDEVRR